MSISPLGQLLIILCVVMITQTFRIDGSNEKGVDEEGLFYTINLSADLRHSPFRADKVDIVDVMAFRFVT